MGLDWKEGTNAVCIGRGTLNHVSLQKVAWNFFPPSVSHPPSCCPAERGQPSAVPGAEPGDNTIAPCCAFKPPLPSNRRAPQGEEAGGRWLEAQRHWEERARVSSTAKYPDSPLDRTDFVQLSALPCIQQGKSKVACQAGCQPAGERISGSCWLIRWTSAHFTSTEGAGGLCRRGSRRDGAGPGGGEPLLQAQ